VGKSKRGWWGGKVEEGVVRKPMQDMTGEVRRGGREKEMAR
jgi:hypothetical protein